MIHAYGGHAEPVPDPFTQAVTAAACELVRVLVGEAFGPVQPDAGHGQPRERP